MCVLSKETLLSNAVIGSAFSYHAVAALAFDDWGQWGGKQSMWGPTGKGRSNSLHISWRV